MRIEKVAVKVPDCKSYGVQSGNTISAQRGRPESAAIASSSGNIYYNDAAFNHSYGRLAFYADHERIHRQNALSRKDKIMKNDYIAIGKEEGNIYIQNYKRQGLYRNFELDLLKHIDFYGPYGDIGTFQSRWWHEIYKIPRLW